MKKRFFVVCSLWALGLTVATVLFVWFGLSQVYSENQKSFSNVGADQVNVFHSRQANPKVQTMNEDLLRYYEYLKSKKADLPDSFESFSKTMAADDTSAKKFYEYVKAKGFDAPDTFESFSKLIKNGTPSPSPSAFPPLQTGMNEELLRYYEYLKSKKADLPDNFESFRKAMADDTLANKYYEYVKAKGFDAPDTFESFSKLIKKKNGSPSQVQNGQPQTTPLQGGAINNEELFQFDCDTRIITDTFLLDKNFQSKFQDWLEIENENEIRNYVYRNIKGLNDDGKSQYIPKKQYLFEDSLLSENFHRGHLNTGPFFSDSTRLIYSSFISLRFDEYYATVDYKTFEETYEFDEGAFGLFVITAFSGLFSAILFFAGIVWVFKRLITWVKERRLKNRRSMTIAKVSIIVIFALLVITNPSHKDFKEYVGYDNNDIHVIVKRESNFMVFSVYSRQKEGYGKTTYTTYYGILANFFKKE